MSKSIYIILLITITLYAASCRKDNKITTSPNATLLTSVDSLSFDTVFTTVGSITKPIKIINTNNQKLLLSQVRLLKGSGSSFRINVDGSTGPVVSNVELAANDSTYIFVNITVNPTAANLPFVITDSILIQYNGNNTYIKLQAYGLNAVFLNNTTITANTTWNNAKPYVLLGGVRVDTTAILTITEGARIYAHAGATLIVDGTLITQGKRWDSTRITFTGDRLDEPYKNYPASWPGIWLRPSSKNNQIQYTNILNAYQAIIVDGASVNAAPKLILNETIIDNALDVGILAINSSIQAKNCLVSNCGKNIGIALGGTYQIEHSTVVSISNSNILHKDPVLTVLNYSRVGNTVLVAPLSAVFRNCIFWGAFGTAEDEVLADKAGSTPYNVSFTNCLYKVKTTLSTLITASNSLANATPLFDSINTSKGIYNFRHKLGSPTLNVGGASSIAIDLDGAMRPVGIADMGCYERQ